MSSGRIANGVALPVMPAASAPDTTLALPTKLATNAVRGRV